ncbi:MAG: DMT family transporter [Anaerotignaceae bacterium]
MSNKTKGIMYIVIAAFFFALMNTFVKLAGDVPFIQKSFFRNLIAFFIAVYVLSKSQEKFIFNKSNLPYLIIRSGLGTLGVFCNYYAIERLILADASMLGKLAPFFAIIFSFFILKEKVKSIEVISICVAFIGSLFIIKPTMMSISDAFPAIIGAAGAAFAGGAYTFVRFLGNRGERGPFVIFFFSGFSCLCALPFIVFNYYPMSFAQLSYLILAGVSASVAQFAVTNAYFNAPAKEISIFDYTQVIFAAVMGLIIYGQLPDMYSFIGYTIIIGISIITFLKHKHDDKVVNKYQHVK